MKLELVTPFGIKRSEDAYEVVLPTLNGEITVFPGHEPLITLMKHGVMMVRRNKSDADSALEAVAVAEGIVEITSDTIRILANEAEEGDEIVVDEARAALIRAEKMKAEAKNQVELETAHKLLQHQSARLKVAELHRRRHRDRKGILPR
jgi:F-type H+-transporting ATPase subunit epsilon